MVSLRPEKFQLRYNFLIEKFIFSSLRADFKDIPYDENKIKAEIAVLVQNGRGVKVGYL
jgi:hypothetical protein